MVITPTDMSHANEILTNAFNSTIDNFYIPELKQLIRDECYIAGGSIRSLLTHTRVNDYDFYFRNQEARDKFLKLILLGLGDKLYSNNLSKIVDGKPSPMMDEDCRIKHFPFNNIIIKAIKAGTCNVDKLLKEKPLRTIVSQNAITILTPTKKIQFILKTYGSPKDVINTFDFTNSMAFFDPNTEGPHKIECTPHFLESIKQKRLIYNSGCLTPLETLSRVDKFTKQGYHIPWNELKKLLVDINSTCTNQQIKDYEGRGAY